MNDSLANTLLDRLLRLQPVERLDELMARLGLPAADRPLDNTPGGRCVKFWEWAKEYNLLDRLQAELDRLMPDQGRARQLIHLPFPSLGTLFKGREDILPRLRDSLRREDVAATAIVGMAVHGLGGVGKTRLAVEYAWQHAAEFSAVLFVVAESPEALSRNLAALVGPKVLHLPEQEATEEEVQVAAVLRWLREHPGWLLIFDNVDTELAAECVEQLLPRLLGGQVLITSRLARWGEHVQPLQLDVLSPESAASFLLERTKRHSGGRGRTPQPTDDADADALAQELGGLALALEQAGAYIVHQRITLAEYRRRWREHERQVQEWYDPRQMKYPRSLATTWQTTLDQLGPEAIGLLNLLAWFAPEPIPLRSLRSPRLNPEGTAEDAESAEVLPDLADFSLLRWDAAAGTVTVHRVVQEILRTRQPEPRQCLIAVLRLLVQALPADDPGDVRTWPVWEPLRMHVAFAVAEADRFQIDEPTSVLTDALGVLLSAKALHAEAEQLQRCALALNERHFGPDSTQVALRLNNLAQTLQATNRLAEAERLMARVATIFEKSLGENHPNVATALNNLAALLQATNRLAEAEPLMRRALAIVEQSFGPEHPYVANCLNNLAALLQATNRLAEAEPLMRRALAIVEQSVGPEHPNVATTLNNLAQLLQATNRQVEAEPLMRRALAIVEQSFRPEHPNVANCLNNLATLLQATDRLAEAEPLMRRVVTIFEESLGENHPNVATALNNLAQLLQDTNRLAEAEPLMRRALAIDEQSFGPQHSEVALKLWNLAVLLHDTRRLSEAIPLMRRSVAIYQQFEAANRYKHPHSAEATGHYREMLHRLGKSDQEIQVDMDALSRHQPLQNG